MPRILVANAFSANMLPREPIIVYFEPITQDTARRIAQTHANELVSVVGHEDIARIISQQLGITVPVNRVDVKLQPDTGTEPGDIALIAQYSGPRLPAGTTSLPEGATIEYWLCGTATPFGKPTTISQEPDDKLAELDDLM